ncbi:MAG: hypothetical protein HRT89_18175 [Lentisphaeria bacterium]|nr:hypothetical protein [Lentisphaeria bacterium]
MTEDLTKPGLMVLIADLMYRALKLARRRWYVLLMLGLICTSPLILRVWRVWKLKSSIAQLKKDNPQVLDWRDASLRKYNPANYTSWENANNGDKISLSDMDESIDIDSLKTMPVKGLELIIKNPLFRDLSALEGLSLKYLFIAETQVSDLSALKGMPLTKLYLGGCPVSDLSPLKDMPLEYFYIPLTNVSDISALKGARLKTLDIKQSKVIDISILKGMSIDTFNAQFTKISDISALKGMPLEYLKISDTEVSDISPLEGTLVKYLYLENTKISDLSALKGMQLNILRLPITAKKINFLRSMKSLEKINGMKPDEFWKEYDEVGEIPEGYDYF